MQRFRSILVVPHELHGDDPAIRTATDLALRTGARLTLLAVDGWTPPDAPSIGAALARLARGMGLVGVRASCVVLDAADPAALILDEARRRETDLIIKTARPEDVPSSRVFSSVATRLLREAACPVWVMREPRSEWPPRVLAAVGPADQDPEALKASAEVLDVAGQLAAARSAELHVVSAWRAIGAGLLRHRLPEDVYQAHTRETAGRASVALRELLDAAPVDVPAANIHLRPGLASRVIAEVADAIGADVVVVGSAGRSGVRRWLLGNTAEDVLRATDRAVVAVRPGRDAEADAG